MVQSLGRDVVECRVIIGFVRFREGAHVLLADNEASGYGRMIP